MGIAGRVGSDGFAVAIEGQDTLEIAGGGPGQAHRDGGLLGQIAQPVEISVAGPEESHDGGALVSGVRGPGQVVGDAGVRVVLGLELEGRAGQGDADLVFADVIERVADGDGVDAGCGKDNGCGLTGAVAGEAGQLVALGIADDDLPKPPITRVTSALVGQDHAQTVSCLGGKAPVIHVGRAAQVASSHPGSQPAGGRILGLQKSIERSGAFGDIVIPVFEHIIWNICDREKPGKIAGNDISDAIADRLADGESVIARLQRSIGDAEIELSPAGIRIKDEAIAGIVGGFGGKIGTDADELDGIQRIGGERIDWIGPSVLVLIGAGNLEHSHQRFLAGDIAPEAGGRNDDRIFLV